MPFTFDGQMIARDLERDIGLVYRSCPRWAGLRIWHAEFPRQRRVDRLGRRIPGILPVQADIAGLGRRQLLVSLGRIEYPGSDFPAHVGGIEFDPVTQEQM